MSESKELSLLEKAKKTAAIAAVDEFVKPGMKLGIGSGSTVVYAIARVAELFAAGKLPGIHCVPTSFQSKNLIVDQGLPLSDLSIDPVLDVAIDGADECDSKLNCIKGGGGAQTLEKCVAFNAKQFVVIADYRKHSEWLGQKWRQGVPIEVIPFAYKPVMIKIEKELGGKPKLREAKMKAGPVVTDNGNFIIDADFGEIKDPKALDDKLLIIPGVVETGLFCNMVVKAFFGNEDGTFITVDGPKKS